MPIEGSNTIVTKYNIIGFGGTKTPTGWLGFIDYQIQYNGEASKIDRIDILPSEWNAFLNAFKTSPSALEKALKTKLKLTGTVAADSDNGYLNS